MGLRAAAVCLVLAGCGYFTTDDGTGRPARDGYGANENPIGVPIGAPGSPILSGGSPVKVAEAIKEGPTLDALPADQPGLVVLAIIDTVRASSMAACGSSRASGSAGSVLHSLVERGATLTCHAYAPATWTLPSHASFFTGLAVGDHGLHRKGVRMSEQLTTLAEIYTERGYQTLLVSANPVLKEDTGLQQGFQQVRLAAGLAGALRGDGFAATLKLELAQLDPKRPTFLVINIFEAHDPYPAIPAGTEGFVERPGFAHRVGIRTPDNQFYKFITGEMSPDESGPYLGHALDTYEYGVSLADRVLARSLRLLERAGWTAHGARLVVTSDHGEAIGEHGYLGHDGPPWEPLARVPFLFWDTQGTKVDLPEPFPASLAFELLRDGKLPAELPAPVAMAFAYGEKSVRFRDGAAIWLPGRQKLAFVDGQAVFFDLVNDPEELHPYDVAGHPREAELRALIARHAVIKAQELATDPAAIKALERLGYVDE